MTEIILSNIESECIELSLSMRDVTPFIGILIELKEVIPEKNQLPLSTVQYLKTTRYASIW